ncbi:unnamed protein product, partial [Mesorhabditis spiculigera]
MYGLIIFSLCAGAAVFAADAAIDVSPGQKLISNWRGSLTSDNHEQLVGILNGKGSINDKLDKLEKLAESDASKKKFFEAKSAINGKLTEANKIETSLSDSDKALLASFRTAEVKRNEVTAGAKKDILAKLKHIVYPLSADDNGENAAKRAKIEKAKKAATKKP